MSGASVQNLFNCNALMDMFGWMEDEKEEKLNEIKYNIKVTPKHAFPS